MRAEKLITRATTLSLNPFCMSSIHSMGMMVRLCWKQALMVHSKRELKFTWLGTSRLHDVNLTLMALSTIILAAIMEVRIGNFHISLVLVQVRTLASPSHSFFSPLGVLSSSWLPNFPQLSHFHEKWESPSGGQPITTLFLGTVVPTPLLNRFFPPSLMFTVLVLP
jgi:hypothetical protein